MDLNTFITAAVNNGIGFACALAILILAWYRETKTLPALMKTFTDGLTAQQEGHEKHLAKIIDANTITTREERAVCQRWHEENRQDGLRHHEENQKAQSLILAELKENRHYVRDLANQAGLRRAVDEERAKRGQREEDA